MGSDSEAPRSCCHRLSGASSHDSVDKTLRRTSRRPDAEGDLLVTIWGFALLPPRESRSLHGAHRDARAHGGDDGEGPGCSLPLLLGGDISHHSERASHRVSIVAVNSHQPGPTFSGLTDGVDR